MAWASGNVLKGGVGRVLGEGGGRGARKGVTCAGLDGHRKKSSGLGEGQQGGEKPAWNLGLGGK